MHSQSLWAVGLVAVVSLACSKSPAGPPVFGGTGATIAHGEQPLPKEEPAPNAGPCGAAAPPSDTPLFDDFEDGDNQIFKGFRREGWWFVASDKTEGAVLSPSGEVRPERLSADAASTGNLFAAHFVASGHRDWGAIWGVGVHYSDKGIRCPLNASAFAGFKFRARGNGTVRFALGVPETLGAEASGSCRDRCWDTHGKLLFLSDQWQEYVVPWDRLQQEGWGEEARFDATRILQVAFSARAKEQPVDFWIDDLAFVSASEIPKPPAVPAAVLDPR